MRRSCRIEESLGHNLDLCCAEGVEERGLPLSMHMCPIQQKRHGLKKGSCERAAG